MGVEIVLNENDFLGLREVAIGEIFQGVSIVHGSVTIGDFDMPPAFERREHHEEVGRPVALVFVVEAGRASRFHLDRRAGFGNQLLRGLVQTNQWAIAIAWPGVDGQHVFHRRYKRAVGLRRNDPALTTVGSESPT